MTQTSTADTVSSSQESRKEGLCARHQRGESRACILHIIGGIAMLGIGLTLLLVS